MISRSLCPLPSQPLSDLHLPPAQQAAQERLFPHVFARMHRTVNQSSPPLSPTPSCFSQRLGECYSPQTSSPCLSECITVTRREDGLCKWSMSYGPSAGEEGVNSWSISWDRASHPRHPQKEHLEET